LSEPIEDINIGSSPKPFKCQATLKGAPPNFSSPLSKHQKVLHLKIKIIQTITSCCCNSNPVEIKDENYYAVSGYNLSDEIKYYGLDYNAYTHPGHL